MNWSQIFTYALNFKYLFLQPYQVFKYFDKFFAQIIETVS
jgi:hypothetical protein